MLDSEPSVELVSPPISALRICRSVSVADRICGEVVGNV
jgi:hypothetical protein